MDRQESRTPDIGGGPSAMSIVSQRFSRIPEAGGTASRENIVVSLGGAIGARGLPSQLDLRPCKPLTCTDAGRAGPNDRLRGLLRLTECSHYVGSSGIMKSRQTRVPARIDGIGAGPGAMDIPRGSGNPRVIP
jgi:hypothetical protein